MSSAKVYYLFSLFFSLNEILEQASRQVTTEEPSKDYKHAKRRYLHNYNMSGDEISSKRKRNRQPEF